MLLDIKLTQGTYWKGSQIPYWLYMTFAIFPITGLLGIDHLLLRSPWTAFFKFITLIPLLGFWYFYDIAQAAGEREFIEKYGLAVPFYGPTGIGAGMFIGKDIPISSPEIARPWRYLAYVFTSTLLLITPLNKVILGDYVGAFLQLIMYVLFPLTFLAIAWGFYDAYRIFFDQRGLFEKGGARVLPASWILGDYFKRSALGPLPDEPVKSSAPSWWPFRFASAVAEIPIVAAKATSGVVGLVANEGVQDAKEVMHSGTGVVKESIAAADTIVKSSVQPLATAAEKAGVAAIKTAELLEKLPNIAEKVTAGLGNPDVIAKKVAESSKAQIPAAPAIPAAPVIAAAPPMVAAPAMAAVMKGGALSNGMEPSVSSSVLIFSVALLAFSGYVIYTFRKTLHKTTDDDDTPPEPGSVRGTFKSGVQE